MLKVKSSLNQNIFPDHDNRPSFFRFLTRCRSINLSTVLKMRGNTASTFSGPTLGIFSILKFRRMMILARWSGEGIQNIFDFGRYFIDIFIHCRFLCCSMAAIAVRMFGGPDVDCFPHNSFFYQKYSFLLQSPWASSLEQVSHLSSSVF